MDKIEHLVVDANAFLKNVPLQDIGEKIYTVPEVVSEIRDSATRQRLQVLPYDLILKEPLFENVQFVTRFAKATGDYPSLSLVDIRLMALTYQLTKENLDSETAAKLLKTEPEKMKVETVLGSGKVEKKSECLNSGNKNDDNDDVKQDDVDEDETSEAIEVNENENQESMQNNETCLSTNVDASPVESMLKEEESESEDDEGWITPRNYVKKLKEIDGTVESKEDIQIPVACQTTDFAMQNVMLHIGLQVMSTNGMLIKNLRTYILRCYACFRTTSVMTKVFCPSCGNKTLKKVSVSLKPDGSLVLHLSRRVNLTGRGKKFPLPAPKGGKHSNNPVLTEDQRIPQQRPSKMALQKNNPLGVDYIANSSPFTMNDVYSRASVLGINTKYSGTNYWDKKNPNESRRRTGKKKN